MSVQVQFRRGNTAQHSAFTGAPGEITVDTDKNVIVVHDGSTAGGFPLASLSSYGVANAAFTHSNTTYAAVNSAFAVINSAFGSVNTVGGYANTIGGYANQAGVIANAAFGLTNTTYAAVNSSFGVINAGFGVANSAYSFANGVNTFAYGVAVNAAAAFAAANNVGPQIAPAYNTANAAFNKANLAATSANATLTGTTTISGTVDFSGSSFKNQTLTDAATINWNTASGTIATVTLGGDRVMGIPSNLQVTTYLLHVYQDGTGGRTLDFSTAGVFKWPSGGAPIISTDANAHDVISFVSDGTYLYGSWLPDVK